MKGILIAGLLWAAMLTSLGDNFYHPEVSYVGIGTGCQPTNSAFTNFSYYYANWPGQYDHGGNLHVNCYGEATLIMQPGDPMLPQNLVLRSKHPQGLAVCFTHYTWPGEQVTYPTAYLGDANNDNSVDIGDYSIIHNAFGCDTGDACYDARADFLYDLVVDSADWNLYIGSFGRAGCSPLFAPQEGGK